MFTASELTLEHVRTLWVVLASFSIAKSTWRFLEYSYHARYQHLNYASLEDFLDRPVVIFSHVLKGGRNAVLYQSLKAGTRTVRLFYHIEKGFSRYSGRRLIVCQVCERIFTENKLLVQHLNRKKCKDPEQSKKTYPASAFPNGAGSDLFTGLASVGISVPDSLRLDPSLGVYDFECKFVSVNERRGDKTIIEQELQPLSFALASNVPELASKSPYFYWSLDSGDVFENFWNTITEWGLTAGVANKRKFKPVFMKLNRKILQGYKLCDRETKGKKGRTETEQAKEYVRYLKKLKIKLNRFISQLCFLGFSSSQFDLSLIRKYLVRKISQNPKLGVLRRNNAYIMISSKEFKLLDFQRFLGPGFSLKKTVDTFAGLKKNETGKLKFPFSILREENLLERLGESAFPPRSAFTNSLTDLELSLDEYLELEAMYLQLPEPRTVLDWLRVYNVADCVPLLKSALNFTLLFRDLLGARNVFKEFTTLPSIARQLLSDGKESGAVIVLANSAESENLINSSIVGGSSIILHRACLNRSVFRDMNLGSQYYNIPGVGEFGSVVSLDSSQLYSSCYTNKPIGVGDGFFYKGEGSDFEGKLNQTMVGNFLHPKFNRTEHLVVSWYEKMIRECVSEKEGSVIGLCRSHKFLSEYNGGQITVGKYRTKVDGFCFECRLVIQYHSCYFHPHRNCAKSVLRLATPEGREAYRRSERVLKHLENDGFTVLTIRECAWLKTRKNNVAIREFESKYFAKPFCRKRSTPAEILAAVASGDFFGILNISASVPDHLRSRYDKFPPFFKKHFVDRTMLTKPMSAEADKNGLLTRPQELLIPSLRAENFGVSSAMLKYYISKGFHITAVHSAVSFLPGFPFKKLGQKLTAARIKAAKDPDFFAANTVIKLTLNSAYGSCLMNPEKFSNFSVANDKQLLRAGRDPLLKHVNLLELDGETFYEIEKFPSKLPMKYPRTIAAFLLSEAKLRVIDTAYFMMEMLGDSMLIVQSDTDNLTVVLRTRDGTLDSLVLPDKREIWEKRKSQYFPVNDSLEEYYKPAIFKVEALATGGFVGLSSKLLVMFDPGQEDSEPVKMSAKGAQRRKTGVLVARKFIEALEGAKLNVQNRGFIRKEGTVYQYRTDKSIGNACYFKRKCGVETPDGGVDFLATSSFF